MRERQKFFSLRALSIPSSLNFRTLKTGAPALRPVVDVIHVMSPNSGSRGSFPQRENPRLGRLFPPAICGGFNFRAIVDYVRRASRTSHASSSARPPAPAA